MAISLFGSASTPSDNGTNTTQITAVTPPGSMTAGMLVWMTATNHASSGTVAISEAGGQTWTSLTQRNATRCRMRNFWCIFNGTWSANPSVDCGGTTNNIVRLLAFQGDYGTQTGWAVDASESSATYTAPTTPFTVTIPSITTATDGALVIATWTSVDDNSWSSLSGSTHTYTALTPAQVRNTSGTYDGSQSHAWMIDSTAGATGTISQNQSLGGDAGAYCHIAFVQSNTPIEMVPDATGYHSQLGDGATLGVTIDLAPDSTGYQTQLGDGAVLTLGGGSGSFDGSIVATADDGYEYTGTWATGEVAFGREGTSNEVIGGLRFTGITIPAGSTITSAYVRVYIVNGSGTGNVLARVRAVDAANPGQFSSGSLPSAATLTSAYTDWTVAMSPLNEWRQSGSLVGIIQELVDSYSGLTSAAINIVLRDNGSSNQYLYAEDYEAAGTNEAEIHIEWTGSGPIDLIPDQTGYQTQLGDNTTIGVGTPIDLVPDGTGYHSQLGDSAVLEVTVNTCDMYLDFRSGSDGDLLTDARASGGSWPSSPPATPIVYPSSPATVLAIETDSASPDLAGTLVCGGVEHDLEDVVQGMRISHSGTASEEVRIVIPSSTVPITSVGFAFKTTLNADLYEQYGHSGIQGIDDDDWAILSTYIDSSGNVHACLETNGALWPSTPSNGPTLASDTWYWITVQYNRTSAKAYLRAYLLSTMAQVGSEVEANLVASPPYAWCVDHGLVASEANSDSGAYSYYGPFMVDWTDGTFPLLPTAPTEFDLITAEGVQTQAGDGATISLVVGLIPDGTGYHSHLGDNSVLGIELNLVPDSTGAQVQIGDGATLAVNLVPDQTGTQVQSGDGATLGVTIDLIPDSTGAQTQLGDGATLGVTIGMAPEEGVQVQIGDQATITVGAIELSPSEGVQTQLGDGSVLGVTIDLIPGEGVQTQLGDGATLGVLIPLSADEGVQTQAGDNATISVGAIDLTPAEGIQVQAGDEPALTQVHILAPAEGAQTQLGDEATISLSINISPQEGSQVQEGDSATLGVTIALAPGEGSQEQSGDTPALTQVHQLEAQEGAQTQAGDQTTLEVGVIALEPTEGASVQYGDTPNLTQVHNLSPDEGSQTQLGDGALLSLHVNLLVAEGLQTQGGDTPGLIQQHNLSISEGLQEHFGDLANLVQQHNLELLEGFQTQFGDPHALDMGTTFDAQEGSQDQLGDISHLNLWLGQTVTSRPVPVKRVLKVNPSRRIVRTDDKD
jgi:hypothetical protein